MRTEIMNSRASHIYSTSTTLGITTAWWLTSPGADHPTEFESPVMGPHEWSEQRKAEASAGLEHPDRPRFFLCNCQLCGVGMGPGYLSEDVYIFFARNEWVYDKNDNYLHVKNTWIEVCFSCGHRKERESFCIFDASHASMLFGMERDPKKAMEQYLSLLRKMLLTFPWVSGLPCTLKILFILRIFSPAVPDVCTTPTPKKTMTLSPVVKNSGPPSLSPTMYPTVSISSQGKPKAMNLHRYTIQKKSGITSHIIAS